MNTVNSTASTIIRAKRINIWFVQFGSAFLLTLIADWLFFEHKFGFNVTLFLLILATISLLLTFIRGRFSASNTSLLIILLALLPGLETLNFLTVAIGLVGITGFVLFINNNRRMPITVWLKTIARFFGSIPFQYLLDIFWFRTAMRRLKPHRAKSVIVQNWFVPILLTLGFLVLFALANPVIFGWLARIDILWPLRVLNLDRIVFWLTVLVFCWPYLRVRRAFHFSEPAAALSESQLIDIEAKAPLFSEAQVSRALLLFNILFGVQTYLDLVYLWGEGSLPEGVTYSQYVHRGTYILLVTTLLAAMFILFVTSRKMGMESSKHIKLLLLLWTAQNIVLVISTMMRMGLYVEAFALTYLRLAAIVWMGLVMMGLVLIIVRLLRQHTNRWLVRMNLMTLALTLYVISFANLPYLISSYNVSIAIDNPGKSIDLDYIASLGEQALPAIDRVLENPRLRDPVVNPDGYKYSGIPLSELSNRYRIFTRTAHTDWRQWSFRRLRLVEYIEHDENLDKPSTNGGL